MGWGATGTAHLERSNDFAIADAVQGLGRTSIVQLRAINMLPRLGIYAADGCYARGAQRRAMLPGAQRKILGVHTYITTFLEEKLHAASEPSSPAPPLVQARPSPRPGPRAPLVLPARAAPRAPLLRPDPTRPPPVCHPSCGCYRAAAPMPAKNVTPCGGPPREYVTQRPPVT